MNSFATLLTLGKERGYLLIDEVNELLPAEEHTPEEIDNAFFDNSTRRD